MSRVVIRYIRRAVHRDAVARWHAHHDPTLGETFALGAFVDDDLVAAGVMGVPTAPKLQDGATWEVARLAVGPEAPRYTASRLLGACARVMDAAGIDRQVSYTRVDEKGSCFKAAGWLPVAYVQAREHDGTAGASGGNRATWLPGLYEPSTVPIDRIRWERGRRAAPATVDVDGRAVPVVEWDPAASLWVPTRRAA